ncbi:MAG: MFS transporter, partial [Acidimicrobiales bacterium]
LRYASGAGRWVVAATVLGSGMAGFDATVVGIALPSIHRSFHASLGSLQWVINGYSLTLAAFILLGGSLGDQRGRRRVFSWGVVWFAVASAICGFAPSSGLLIAARVVQGVGGALLTPASLAILQASFRPGDRGQAIGAWSGLGGVAAAAGPLIGGYLIAAASWRWVFFINLPVAALVLAVTARHVPESSDPTAVRGVDVRGVALGVLFLAGLTYALIDGPGGGWGKPLVIVALVASLLAGPGFVLTEKRVHNPTLPLGIFSSRQFSAANAVTFVMYGALGSTFFLLPVELQVVAGYSPLESGVSLLPLTVIMLLFSARSGRLAARIGPRLQMSVGPVVTGVGLALFMFATHSGSYLVEVLPALLVFSVGLAITVAPLTATALGAAPTDHAGMASAVNNVVARAAGLIAVAVLPALAGLTGGAALQPHTFAAGFHTAVLIAGGITVAAGALAAVTISDPRRQHRKTTVLGPLFCALDSPPKPAHQGPAAAGGAGEAKTC